MNGILKSIVDHITGSHQQMQQQTHETNQGLLGVLGNFLHNPVSVQPPTDLSPTQDNISPQPFSGGDTLNPQMQQGGAFDANNPQSQALGLRMLQGGRFR